MTVNAMADSPKDKSGNYDPKKEKCLPDKNILKDVGIKTTFQHRTKMFAQRRLQFHEDEIVTNVRKF